MEHKIKIAVTPELKAPLHQRYARVLALVGAGALHRRNRQSQRGSLEEAGRAIRTFTDFRQLCALDLRETWCHDRDFKVRTVHNRIETWERVYAHWRKWRGGPDHGPVLLVSAVDKACTYSIATGEERRTSEERLWDTIEKAYEKLQIPAGMVAGFRNACERIMREACHAQAEQGKVNPVSEPSGYAPPEPK